MTRYYGLYARHRESDQKLRKAVPKSKRRILLDFNKWRQLTLLSFGYDPLQCPKCNHKMEFLELYHKHKPVSLEKLYERSWQNIITVPVVNLLDFISCLFHTGYIIRQEEFPIRKNKLEHNFSESQKISHVTHS